MKTRMGVRVGLLMGAGLGLACQVVSPGEGGLKLPDGFTPPGLPIEPRLGDGDDEGPRISLPDEPLPPPPWPLPPFDPGTGSGPGTGPGTGPGPGAPSRPWLRASFYAGVSPQGLAVGDFDEDGAPDVAINAGGRGIQNELVSRMGEFLWLRNNGAGVLERASAPSPQMSSGRIAVGDADGDGHQDVVLGTARGLRLLRGLGTGALWEQPIEEANHGTVSNLGFWHAPGRASLLWSLTHARAQRPGSAGVFMTRPGDRGSWVSQSLSRNAGSVSPVLKATDEQTPGVVADFDADGRPDVALNEFQSQGWVVNILLNNAEGVLALHTSVPGPPALRRLYAARLNLDEHVDLLGLSDSSQGPSSLVVFPGRGNGDFSFHAPVNLVLAAADLALVDYDGDGHLDVVVLHTSSGQVSLLRGGPDGRLVPHARMQVGRGPSAAAVADLDGDGTLELLITEADDNVVSVYTVPPVPSVPVVFGPNDVVPSACPLKMEISSSTSRQELYPLAQSRVGAGDTAALVSADFDGDGRRDLALTRAEGVLLMFRGSDGSFLNQLIPDTAQATGLSVADFDGDGRMDLAVSTPSGLSVLWNDPQLRFQARTRWRDMSAPLAGDFNGDGRVDLAVSFTSSTCQGGTGRMLNLGQRVFSAHALIDHNAVPNVTCHSRLTPLAGDYDGDGGLDLVHFSLGINIDLSLDKTQGASRPGHGFELPTGFGTEAWSVDATGDGKLDVLVRANYLQPDLLLFPGDGQGSLLAPFSCPPSIGKEILAWADLDGDGLLEVIGLGADGSSIWVLRGAGHGRWHEPRLYGMGGLVRKVLAVDLWNDARPELVVVTSEGELKVFLLP